MFTVLMAKDCKMLELLKEDDNGIELSLGLSIGGSYSTKKSDYKMLIECQRSQKRAIHREMMENEEQISAQKVRRKGEIGTFSNECGTYEAAKSLNLSLNQDSNVNNQNVEVPFWDQNAGKRELMKKNVLQGDDCRGFRRYNENRGGNMSYNQCMSSESEGNFSSKSSVKNCKTLSNGSPERCSSTISECQSSSPKGRSSSDNAQGIQPSTSGRKHTQFEQLTTNVIPIKEEQNQNAEKRMQFDAKVGPNSTNQANVGPFSSPLKQIPKSEIKNCGISLLSRMPCVSTTGNGPNGKTIRGLLYRYNNRTEISIICVCHGKSFTPSEFVEHAGGVDVSHPLRHITVIPPCS
ncbi:uncharacterized protein LOC107792595 [Nicotiana tabacum]|uniref:Ninja-family protein n=1 Tax=Nicotiana tabacum TaxID=4097 RepID=A0A1S4A0V4_TOBAC|nr:PREDICTED: ninja-family protein 3-like [Nicotiana tabacum]XP_033514941.1 ninja-family protein 3-like [Nicotiana tomentosiformis]